MDRQSLHLQQIYSKTLLQVEISVRPEAATLRYQLGDFAVVITCHRAMGRRACGAGAAHNLPYTIRRKGHKGP
jgi:hypothetical protein